MAAVLLALMLSCVAAGFAAAADAEGAPATGTTTGIETTAGTAEATTGSESDPETTGGTTTTDSKSTTDDDDNRGIAILIFILGALAVVLAYVFYDRWRKSYETLALSALKTTGTFPNTIFNPVELAQFQARALGEQQTTQKPVVVGPAAVTVDVPATYSATADNAPADSCSRTVEPVDAAKIEPATGASVTVTASKEGAFTLNAKIGDGEPTPVPVTAMPKAASSSGIPLLGTGFAGFTAAIIAIALAAGLTVLNVLGSEAFIAFLGPLVGYFFAQGKDTGHGAAD